MITTENEIAFGVLQIAATQTTDIASFQKLRKEIPNYVSLTDADWEPSITRNGEPMWHQIVRNVKSHHEEDGNFINSGYLEHIPRVGYKATKLGLKYLNTK